MTAEPEPTTKPGAVKRLYNWVLSWAESPYGVAALFLIALIESSVFPIPPDVLLLALALGAPRRSFYFALVCAAGSVVGGVAGYYIGYLFKPLADGIIGFYGMEQAVATVEGYYLENAFMYIAIAGFSPIPYKAFTITAGLFGVPLMTLVAASLLSRTGRFLLVAGFVYLFGEKARDFIEKYFDYVTIAFTVLLIGGFVAIKDLH